MFLLEPTGGPGLGLRIRHQTVPCINRESAAAAGELLMFDLALVDASVTDNALDGGDQSGFANVIDPNTTQRGTGWFCLTKDAVAVDEEFDAIVTTQRVSALVHTAGGGSAAAYDALYPDQTELNALSYDAPAVTVNLKQIGVSLGVVTTPTTPALGVVAFSGIVPLGAAFTET